MWRHWISGRRGSGHGRTGWPVSTSAGGFCASGTDRSRRRTLISSPAARERCPTSSAPIPSPMSPRGGRTPPAARMCGCTFSMTRCGSRRRSLCTRRSITCGRNHPSIPPHSHFGTNDTAAPSHGGRAITEYPSGRSGRTRSNSKRGRPLAVLSYCVQISVAFFV